MLSSRLWRAFLRNLFLKPKRRSLPRLRFEQLEDRVVPVTVTWINSGSGNWDVGTNWSTGNVPGAADTAIINTTAAATITIDSSDTEAVSQLSLGSNDTLSITGGSLSIQSSSTLSGTLSMSGGSLIATGSGVTVSATGSTSISAANLYAENGATLSLPGLTSYAGTNSATTLEATGTGSVLALANLTTVTETANNYDAQIQFYALSDGTVNLSSLQQINTGTVLLESDGTGSELNLSALTSFDESGGWAYSTLQASNDGTLSESSLASLSDINFNVSGASEDITLSSLTSIDGSNVTVSNGATLNLPGVASYTGTSSVTTLEATGTGSVLALANLTTVTETANNYDAQIQFEALSDGSVNLSALQQINTGTVILESDGTGSELNVSALTSFTETGGWTYSTLQASNDGIVSDSGLTGLSDINFNVSGVSEGITLASLTSIDGSNVTVSDGATLNLPGVASYTGTNSATTLEATGSGSVLALANLSSISEPDNGYDNQIQFEALAGGTLTLSALQQLSTGTVVLESDGTGSELNVSTLSGFTETGGWSYSTLQASNNGAISESDLASLSDVNFNVSGASEDITLASLTSFDGCNVTVSGGATLSLPGVTSYTGRGYQTTLEATGTGSVLTLNNLSSIAEPNNGYDNQIQIEALAGATVNLSALQQINTGTVILESDSSGSELNVSALTSFSETGGWTYSTLQASNGGTVSDSDLASLSSISVNISGSSPNISLAGLSSLDNDNVSISGSGENFTLGGVTSFNGANITVSDGATLSLPGVTSYSESGATTLEATGTGSILTFADLTSVSETTSGYDDQIQLDALAGGTVSMSALTALSGTVDLDVDGTGSEMNFNSLTSFTGASIAVGDGGSLQIGSSDIDMPASGTGATITIPQLQSGLAITLESSGAFTGGTTFNIPAGDDIILTGSGSYTGGVTFNLGQGATVDLTGGEQVNYGGTLTGSGGGTVQLSSGGIDPTVGGLTLDFTGNTFQWTGGAFFESVGNVTNLGTINLTGSNDKGIYEDGTFYNYGTLIQTGSGNLDLHSDNVSPTTLINESGGSYLIESDSGIDNGYGGVVAVQNAGTITKTSGSGTSQLYINGSLSNTGTIQADSGTLYLDANSITQVSNGSLTAGTWNAIGGATLEFPTGTSITNNAANISLSGKGANVSGIADLASNSGNFTIGIGASFTSAGNFTNSGTLTIGGTLDVTGNFAQASGGTIDEQIGGTPASGQFGQIATTGTATLAGTFGLYLVNGFVPQAGEAFATLTFSQASGNFSTITGLDSYFTSLLTVDSFNLVNGSGSPVDLVTSNVTAPSTATDGQSITVNWEVLNQSSNAAAGNWRDSVFLSTTPTITSSSILLGSVQHSGGLAANASYQASLNSTLPGLPPGNYYVIVEADSLYQLNDTNRANAIMTAPEQLAVSLPVITLGTPLSGTFTTTDDNQYYQITVPAGGSLTLALNSAASSGATALYVGQGTLPTPYNSLYSAGVANQPDQSLTIPQVLTSGTYYILAQGVSGAAATAGFTLTATQTNAITITSLSANSGGNAGNFTIGIDGTNFTPNATATLTLGSTTIDSSTIDYVSASQIYATFKLSGATPGSYTLNVHEGTQSVTAPSPFQVVAATKSNGLLDIKLSLPEYIRAGRTANFVITYTNTTDADIVAPLLQITSNNANIYFSTPDDPTNFVQSAQVLAVASSGPAGILRPGQSGTLTITVLSVGTGGETTDIKVTQLGKDDHGMSTIDWSKMEAASQPSTITTAAWNVIWNNLMNTVGTTVATYESALAAAATYLGNLGDTAAQVSDISRLWSFLIAQADDAYPTSVLTSTLDASLPIPGDLSLAIDRTFQSTISGRYASSIFGQGWVTSWQTSLNVDSSGDVTITSGANVLSFFALPNGTYLDATGDYGTLTQSGGVYIYTDTNGTEFVFLADGLLNYEQDTNGNRITLGYNGQNQLVSLTYSNANDSSEPTEALTLTYNDQGFVSQVADGTGDVWTYTYDSNGHLLSVTAPGNLTTTYTYDTSSNTETSNALLSITNPDGSQQNFTYNSTTGQVTGTSANGGADPITYSYPGEAEVQATDASGNVTTVWYNDLGLPGMVETPLGGISTYHYDNNGDITSYTDAAGDTYQYTYDSNGNLTSATNPLGQTTTLAYGALSTLTSTTDADGNTTQYSYNSSGDLINITYPGGTSQSFTYDPLGNMTETIEQNGDPVSCQYNSQGLVTEESFADGTSESFTYDAHGNLLTAETFDSNGNLTGTTTLTYNAANELLSITYPNGQYLDFTYNSAGQRTKSVDQDGYTVNYSYNSLGQLSELTDGSSNLIVKYTYNNLGQLVEKQNGNGTYTTYAYDADGNLLTEVNYANSSGTVINSSFTYTYNLLNEMTSMTDASGNTTTYSYDSTGQLTGIALPGGGSITYAYNAAGDRTEVIDNSTTTTDTSNSDNEITSVGSATYTYDANGNLESVTDSSGTTTYAYNDLNQLVSITDPDGTVTTLEYSPLGYLVGENVGGTQTNYLVDPTGLGNVVAAYNGNGSLSADYTYGIGLVSTTGPSGTGYYDFDGSGDTVGITNSSGSYVNSYSYLPFGETTTITATLPNPFTFAGEVGVVQISSNLFNMRARDYTPATGQFLSNDPTGLGGGDSNIRRYVGNDPLNAVDPTGLDDNGNGPSQFFGFSGGLGLSLTLGVTVNSNGQAFLTTGIGGTTGGFSVYSVAPPASAGESTDYTGTIGGTFGGITAHNTFSKSGYSPSVSADVGFKVPGFSVVHLWNIRLGSVIKPPPQYVLVCGPDDPSCSTSGSSSSSSSSGSSSGGMSSNGSHDPNSLVGPGGLYVSEGRMVYTLNFENDGTAAAQVVTATEQLNSNLDWSTFQLGLFGFGSIDVAVPAGLTEYETTVSYENVDGSALDVLVDLDFNVQTGLLTVAFTSIDPATGQAPAGVFDGFLPPDNSSGVGEGFVQYTVEPKSGLAEGTPITGQASVVFDTNSPIETNQVSNDIDDTAPTSSVNALPGDSSSPFTVSWSGSDPNGPGIASYNVYVSTNGGAFTPLLTHTTETSTSFTGVAGDTYSFYSVAIDKLGLVQSTPTSGQASTTVVSYSLANSFVTTSPSTVQSGDTTTVTLQVENGAGNDLTSGGLNVTFSLRSNSGGQGTFSSVTDNGNGTYTATFTGTIAGTNTIVATINGEAVTSTPPTITVTPGAVSLADSVVLLSPSTIQLGGVSTVTLQARDADGNDLTTGGLTVAFSLVNSTGAKGKLSSVKDNGNGTYTATFTGSAVGSNSITANVNGSPITSGPANINVTGAAFSAAKSIVTLSPSTVESGSTTTITLQVVEANGQKETGGGLAVAFKLGSPAGGQGTFGPVTDNGNGTYSATFTGTLAGLNTITATIDGVRVTSTPYVKVIAGPVDAAKSVMVISATTARAGSPITVTLVAKDAAGNRETTGGQVVTFSLGSVSGADGVFSAVKDNKNGTYTATFMGTLVGQNTIVATIGGSVVSTSTPTINITPGPVSLAKSDVTLSSSSVAAGKSITVTLQAVDAYGNKETTGGLKVSFVLGTSGAARGVFGPAVDNRNGTYTATFIGTIAGNDTILATISGYKVTSAAPEVTVTPGVISLAKSVVSLSAASLTSGNSITVTLQAKDAYGNKETSGGQTVEFSLGKGVGKGTFGPVTDNGNGTYSATFTGTIAGANTIEATINGQVVTSTLPIFRVLPGPVSLANSVVVVSASSIGVGGTTKVILHAKDSSGNNETTGGLKILFMLESTSGGLGTFGVVTDNHNGTYTAIFRGTAAGVNAITASIDDQPITSTPVSIKIT